MAEESIHMSLSPELTKLGEGDIRRNSIGTPFLSSNEEKPVPHYLRASIGSCHDFCKYGRKHAFEVKGRSPIRKITATSRPPDAKNPMDKVVQSERKKATVVKSKPSPNSKVGLPQDPKIIKLEVSSPSEKEEVPVDKVIQSERKKATIAKSKPSPNSKDSFPQNPKLIKLEVSSPSEKVEVPVDKVIRSERKKTTVAKSKPPPNSKDSFPQNPKIIKLEVSSPSEKVEVSLKHALGNARGITAVESTVKKVDAPSKQAPSNARGTDHGAKRMTPVKLKPVAVKPLPSPDLLKGSNGRRNSDINLGQRTGTSKVAGKKVLASSAARLSPKPCVDDASLYARKNKSSSVVSPLKNQNRIRKAEPQQPKNSKIQEKTSRITLFSKPSIIRVPSLNTRKYKSVKVVTPLKNLNKSRKAESQLPDEDKVIEKTLYVVKTDTHKKTLSSSPNESPTVKLSPSPLLLSAESPSQPTFQSQLTSPSLSSQEEDQEESEYTISDADDLVLEDDENESINAAENSEEEDYETKNMNEAENSEGEYKGRPQKVRPDVKDSSAVKLNFRRGRVLDLHSETKGPRRLRFRRGRLLGENQNGNNDAGRRSFKRRGVDGDTCGANDESEKVVLRHQGVQGKKDAQGLLNNVIEETASKLVETRKSKVKALVGAFETVISLQETKPSTNTVG